jgi:uncharacterized protein YceK
MNITRHTFIALTVLALAGCASVSGLREKAPDLSLTSTKSPAIVGQCVANGWGEFMGVTINQGPTPSGGYTVSMPNAYTGNNGVLDVSPVSSGSHVTARYRLSGIGGYGKFTKVVKECV